jgi:hypothetical protein
MFDKISRLAEQVATGVSRRAFLARLGLVPLAAATFVGELTAGKPKTQYRCVYQGSCCGGNVPYLREVKAPGSSEFVPYLCCLDDQCEHCGICAVSDCCGGEGSCAPAAGGCFSDGGCSTPC